MAFSLFSLWDAISYWVPSKVWMHVVYAEEMEAFVDKLDSMHGKMELTPNAADLVVEVKIFS